MPVIYDNTCKYCKKRYKGSGKFYCSRRCFFLNNKGKLNLSEKNGMWKGDRVGYFAIHEWVKKRKPKTKYCEKCKINSPYDLANISNKYLRDLKDWEWLCRKCHMTKDGRLNNLIQFKKNAYAIYSE